MPSALVILHENIAILSDSESKRPRGKLEKAKAISAISSNVSTRATIAALTENSTIEMCVGRPTEEMLNAGFLSWDGLAVEVVQSMAKMCEDALSARTKKVPIRHEYMACIRALFKHAFLHGPLGVLRSIVPAFLSYSYQWLSEAEIRDILADDIWQCVRDLLLVEENRAMLSAGYLNRWTDICFQQITGRGPVFHKSRIASNFAHEVFVLLAKPVSTFDVLTQSQKGIHGSDMKGTDFGYALMLEKCCVILVIAKSVKERQARQLQATALKCISAVLERYSLDLVASTAAKKVLELAIPAVLICWTERGYHECAVESAKVLVRLAESTNPAAVIPIRERIERDFGREDGASSVVRSYEDVKESEIEVAGNLFSFEDIIAKIKTRGMSAIHVSAWLRTLAYVLAFRRVSTGNVPLDCFGVINSCARAVQAVSELFKASGDSLQRKLPIDLVRYMCHVMQASTKTAVAVSSRIGAVVQNHFRFSESRRIWALAYSCLMQQLLHVKYARSYKSRGALSSFSGAIERTIMDCVVELLNAGLVDKSAFYSSSKSENSLSMFQTESWQSLFSDGTSAFTDEAARFAHAHIAQTGVRDYESRNYRFALASMLTSFCDPNRADVPRLSALKSCISAVLGLSRGVCSPSAQEMITTRRDRSEEGSAMNAIDAFLTHFSCSDIRAETSAKVLVKKARMSTICSSLDVSADLFYLKSIYWSSSSWRRSELTANEVPRFNVPKSYRTIIERDLVERMLSFLDGFLSDKGKENEEEPSWTLGDSASSTSVSFKEYVKGRFPCFSDIELEQPMDCHHAGILQVTFLISEYLVQGACEGCISMRELEEDDDSSVARLRVLLFLLLTKIAVTPELQISHSLDVVSSLVSSCSGLYLLSRGIQERSLSSRGPPVGSSDGRDENICSIGTFGNLLARFIGNLCQSMCRIVEKKTVSVVQKIKSTLLPGAAARGKKRSVRESQRLSSSERRSPRIRKKRRPNTESRKSTVKKSNAAWSDESDQDMSQDESFLDSDLEPEDDNDFRGLPTPRSRDGIEIGMSSQEVSLSVQKLANVLILSAKTLPRFSEIVVEQCKKCLQRLVKSESRLSPDGPGRALLVSAIIDTDCLTMRTCLWQVLLELDNQTFEVGKDIVHCGKKWEILEKISFSVVSGYAEEISSLVRKHYPPLKSQENFRLSFLHFSSRLLRKTHPLSLSTVPVNLRDRPSVVSPQILDEIISVGEVFRTRDAFRMPRLTRIAYMHFTIAGINSFYRSYLGSSNSSQEMALVEARIGKACQHMRKAISRLLSDCDAGVRMATAGAFHVFINLSKQIGHSDVEYILQDSLPDAEKCRDRSFPSPGEADMDLEDDNYDDVDDEIGDISKILKLSRLETDQLKNIKKSFRFAGASTKSVTALIALGEIAVEQSDLLPFCLFELIRRVAVDESSESIAFNVIIRICMRLNVAGPEELFSISRRLVFPKWFALFQGPQELVKFPARLFFDGDRCRHGAVFDWIRLYNEDILPFILLSDSDSGKLKNSNAYCEILGESLYEMLSSNVGAFSRLYPMMYVGGFDHKGDMLWNAIDAAVNNKSGELQFNKRHEVHASLFLSISAGNSNIALSAPRANSNRSGGFWRDSCETDPPFYDSLIVATALQGLHSGVSNPSVLWRRSDLCGSVFDAISARQNGISPEDFSAVSRGLVKQHGTLIRLLLSAWKLFQGPPGPVHPQNRIDAFFVLATLWRITGVNMLFESNRRRLLLNLVLQGFQYPETAHNALWLLNDIAQRSTEIDEKRRVSLNEIYMNEELVSDMDKFISSRERRMFELLVVSLPVLIDVSLNCCSSSSDRLCQNVATDGLICLLQAASAKEMWTPIASVDIVPGPRMVPGAKVLKQVKAIQEKAIEESSCNSTKDSPSALSFEISRFILAERRCSRARRQIPLTLSRLKQLRDALNENSLARIASLIQDEAWLRSEGRPLITLGLLNEALGILVDINHDVTSCTQSLYHDVSQTNYVPYVRDSDALGNMRELVLQECTWLIGVLGSIYPTAVIFESGRRRSQQRLNAMQLTGRYESPEDAVVKAFPLLRECVFGDCPVIAKAAYSSLVAVLGTAKGKEVFSANKNAFLEPLAELRTIAQKVSNSETELPELFTDLDTGAIREPPFLSVTDKKLWAVEKDEGSESYSRWLKLLTSTLAGNSENDALRMFATTCFVSEGFSRAMFPYLLMDLVGSVGKAEKTLISELISSHILTNEDVPFDSARVIIHGLDFICQLRLNQLHQKGVGKIFKCEDEEFPPLYYLDIPYLVVAKAAARVGMHFSAVRYASLYVDHECISEERRRLAGGRLSGGPKRRLSSRAATMDWATGIRDSARKSAEDVLLLAAENINEPDMIRGLGQHGGLLETASNMAVLDADWGRSAGTLDTLCHRDKDHEKTWASQPSTYGSPPLGTDSAILRRDHMLLASLSGLGCTNLISHYWDALKRKITQQQVDAKDTKTGENISYQAYVGKLNEQRSAAAWKLGDWESPDFILPATLRGESEPVVGLHQTIHKALSALSSGDIYAVQTTVQAGRAAQASWLGQTGESESAQRLYQVADRVRVLNELESVVKILKCRRSSEEDNSQFRSAAFLNLVQLGAKASTIGDSFGSRDVTLDLHVSIARCLGMRNVLARISADAAATHFTRGGVGAWARAAAALGDEGSAALHEASAIDVAAWHMQEAKLRWSASQDGRMKQFALARIKGLIESDLGGTIRERVSNSTRTAEAYQIDWNALPCDPDRVAEVRAESCQLVASWSAAIRAEDPMILFRSYLEMGLLAFKDSANNSQRGLAHYFMAQFADAQLSSIDSYRKTKKYDQMVMAIQETERKVAKLESLDVRQLEGIKTGSGRKGRTSRSQATSSSKNLAIDLRKHISDQKRKMKEDKSRLDSLNEKFKEWQRLSCHHYASSLRDGSQNDLRGSFRLVALWLDSESMREQITADLSRGNAKGDLYVNVPLEKLLPLAPQLCSRLGGSSSSTFQNTLSATLEHMAIKFPSHCLWQLLALSNSTRIAANDERCASFYRGDKGKKDAADRILRRVQASGSQMIDQMRKLANAYIDLSEHKIDRTDSREKLNISKFALFRKMESFSEVPIPTTGLPMYGGGGASFSPACVVGFKELASVCNGLSKPLKVTCLGSDGRIYPQMVKGRDDLRGDAVMEQMFSILNELLHRDPAAARRSLLVRTYRVVPLSPFSGIMQFVDNTAQFKELLVHEGPSGNGERKALHERYRPHDIKHWDIRQGAFANQRPAAKKIQYLSLNWHKFQPVFRYFFLEQWPDPADWYIHQLAYTRSMAVMSIVGFILGIGDRHLSNILVDTVSGEAVHIDFGIAFEQGKLLPTPEQMPFRLSRDIVDGFGVSGVEGTFRHCSEVTLEVMRKNKDVLLTVIEVLLHDPMYNWALTPEEVLNEQLRGSDQDQFSRGDEFRFDSIGDNGADGNVFQTGSEEKGSREAQRALRRIAEKLEGLEDTERLSVEAHVARLIDEARAFQVLASVFPGWAPWL